MHSGAMEGYERIFIPVNTSASTPLYEQIVSRIVLLIERNKVAYGQALPSIRVLARDLGISVITVKKAYEELERRGFVETVPGKGTFIAPDGRKRLATEAVSRAKKLFAEAVHSAASAGLNADEIREMIEQVIEDRRKEGSK